MKKFIFSLLAFLFIVGCQQNNNNKTRFFDNQNNVIFEVDGAINNLSDIENIPLLYVNYIFHAINERDRYLLKESGDTTQPLENLDIRPMDIYLNVDSKLQTEIYNESKSNDRFNNVIIQKNKTAEILAFVDDAIIFNDDNFHNYDSYYFMGKSRILDPVQYYARAFDHLGISTADYINDIEKVYPGLESHNIKIDSPDSKYLGVIPIEKSMKENRSSSYWLERKLIEVLGTEQYEEYYFERDTYRNKTDYDHLRKGTDNEMVHQEFQMLFNDGGFIPPRFINKLIIDNEEIQIPYTNDEILSKEASYLTRKIMAQDNEYLVDLLMEEKYKNFSLFEHSYYGVTKLENTTEDPIHINRYLTVSSTVDISVITSQTYTKDFKKNSQSLPSTIKKITFTILKNQLINENYEKPQTIKQTNYLPESVGEDNLDNHLENHSDDKNPGYSK